MIGEGEPLDAAASGPTKLKQAKEAVQAAAETVKETTQSVADAIDAGRCPGAPLDRLARGTREARLLNHKLVGSVHGPAGTFRDQSQTHPARPGGVTGGAAQRGWGRPGLPEPGRAGRDPRGVGDRGEARRRPGGRPDRVLPAAGSVRIEEEGGLTRRILVFRPFKIGLQGPHAKNR